MAARYPGAEPYLPDRRSPEALRAAVQECRGCPLYADATQAVFGAGPAGARLMLVGEQPGDQEDRAGEPFVGPAGGLLDRALAAAGIDRGQTYVTNAVKHFKWKAKGPRRIHDKPSWSEQVACRPWLELELEAVSPQGIVLLGATAAQSLLGRDFRVTRSRGRLLEVRSRRCRRRDDPPLGRAPSRRPGGGIRRARRRPRGCRRRARPGGSTVNALERVNPAASGRPRARAARRLRVRRCRGATRTPPAALPPRRGPAPGRRSVRGCRRTRRGRGSRRR